MGSSASPTAPIWKKWSITQMLAKPASSAVLPISANFGPIEWGASGQVKRGTCNPIRKPVSSVFSVEASLFLTRLSQLAMDNTYSGVTIDRIADGRIVESWADRDMDGHDAATGRRPHAGSFGGNQPYVALIHKVRGRGVLGSLRRKSKKKRSRSAKPRLIA